MALKHVNVICNTCTMEMDFLC